MKRSYRAGLAVLAILAAAVGVAAAIVDFGGAPSRATALEAPPRRLNEIVVRGRLEPRNGVFAVAAFSLAPTMAVATVSVAEGEAVRKGEVLATLQNHQQALAQVEAANAAVVVAERRLDLTRHPYKDSAIVAQQAAVQARIADLRLAEEQIKRSDALRQRGIVSHEANDIRAAETSRAKANLEEARARLQAATEVPQSQLLLAEAEVAAARAKLTVAQKELALTEIRAPIDGIVLKILAKAGELVSDRPIIEIGDMMRPKAVAEVDERLIPRVRLGQPVRVSVRGSDREWRGTVSRIGRVVVAQTRPPPDTITNRGGRIVEVDARLTDPAGLPPIAGLELLVRIRTR